MKIHDYYRDNANISLNGSIVALIPTILIVGGNLSFFQNKQIMLLTIPFIVLSFFSFQFYLFRRMQSIIIEKNMIQSQSFYQSLYEAKHLVVVNRNTYSPRLMLFFPTGHQAGAIKKYHGKGAGFWGFSKTFVLYDYRGQIMGYFRVKSQKHLTIEVYNWKNEYLGCYDKRKVSWRKNKKELLDAEGRFIGAVEGASYFMDEQIFDKSNRPVTRLRRGWMPLEWSNRFPEANTPILTFSEGLSEKDKLLRMSFLINEYFIER